MLKYVILLAIIVFDAAAIIALLMFVSRGRGHFRKNLPLRNPSSARWNWLSAARRPNAAGDLVKKVKEAGAPAHPSSK